MKPTYQFRYRKDATTYYYVDALGVVGTDGAPVVTNSSVVDWKTFQLDWKRHTFYHGIIKNYSPETIKIAGAGASIMRYVFNTQGDIEAVCELDVYKLNADGHTYSQRAVCAVDFSRYVDGNLYVTVQLMQGGLAAKLNATDTISYTIPIGDPGTDPDADWLWISGNPPGSDPGGVMLLGQYNYQSQGNGDTNIVLNDTPARNFEESTLGIVYVNQEGAYAVAVTNSPLSGVRVDTGAGGGIGLIENANIAKAVNQFTGTFSGSFNFQNIANHFTSTQDARLKIRARVYNGSWATVVDNVEIWADSFGWITPGASSTTLSTGIITYTRTFNPGDFLVITARMETPTSQAAGTTTQLEVQLDTQPTDLQLTFQYRQPDTECRVLSHWQLFRKLFHKITESTAVDPVSNLLTTDVYPGPDVYNLNPVNTFFAPGDALRQLYQDAEGNPTDPAIKTTFRDFTTDALVSLCAGIGIERDGSGNEVLRLEHLRYFYQKDVLIADLGSKITNWQKKRYTEYVGNQVKAGYPTMTYDEVNGRFEFNVESTWKTPVTRVQKDIELKSLYHTGCYDAEYARANLANKKTTDAESDNEVYKFQSSGNRIAMPELSENPYEMDKAHTITAGLPADVRPTVYNVPFTPARNLSRLKPLLKSLYYNIPSAALKFETTKKNADLISTMYTGPTVSEKADIDLAPDGTGEDILFKPWVFEFEAEVPIDLPELMATNPYGVFRHTFIRKGKRYVLDGFVLEAGIIDATRNIYNFSLLCSPNTVIPDDL